MTISRQSATRWRTRDDNTESTEETLANGWQTAPLHAEFRHRTARPCCCGRAASGDVAAAPPKSGMNSTDSSLAAR
jgi:hypothetical protein